MTIQTKFSTGQEVWAMRDNKAVSGCVLVVSWSQRITEPPKVAYIVVFSGSINDIHDEHRFNEDAGLLFSSKEELIANL